MTFDVIFVLKNPSVRKLMRKDCNRHAEIIFLKLLSSKVRIFTNLPIFEGENEDVGQVL